VIRQPTCEWVCPESPIPPSIAGINLALADVNDTGLSETARMAQLAQRIQQSRPLRGARCASANIILTLQTVVRWQRFHKL
jgi:hypothetical protein